MRLKQKKLNQRRSWLSVQVPLAFLLMLVWAGRLLVISRPITFNPDILGATASKAAAKERNLNLVPYPVVSEVQKPTGLARFWLLVDVDSGKVLADEKSDQTVPIASTTKIMTSLIALEKVRDLTEEVSIEKEAMQFYQNIPHVRWGEKFTFKDLLFILMLESDNQVANVIAGFVGGKINPQADKWSEKRQAFIDYMNRKASDLGLKQTKFTDPAGLDESSVSTAFELSIIARAAFQNEDFRQVVSTAEITVSAVQGSLARPLKNSNRLVSEWGYPGILGIKTGFLPNTAEKLSAGHCLVAAAKRDNHTLLAVVLNTYSETPEASAVAAKAFLDWGFKNTTWY